MKAPALALVIAAALPCLAGSRASSLSGSILSPAGAGLAGAAVTITHQDGHSYVSIAGERGLFRLSPLPAGTYAVVAELEGFDPVSATIELGAAEARTLDVTLTPSNFTESLTVTAERPRESLEAAEIRESAARDVGEALATTPGIWSLRKGGIANEVVLRGLQSRDLNVLIDGQRVHGACPNHMDPPSFHVDFAEVDRVEVAKGPFDVRNQGSLGGTINIITRKPASGWQATPNLAAGSWGYLNPAATVSYGRETYSVLGGYSYRTANPYRDGSGASFTHNAGYRPEEADDEAYRIGTAWASAWLQPAGGHAVRLSYTRQRADHVDYPYLQMDAIDDDTGRAQVAYDFAGEGAVEKLSAQATFASVEHWMTDEYRTSSLTASRGYSMGSRAVARTAGGRLEATLHGVITGLEFSHRSWDMTTSMAGMAYAAQHAIPDVAVDVTGVYAETSLPMPRQWTFHAGGRLDWARSAADDGDAPVGLYQAYHLTRTTAREDFFPSGNVRFVWKNDAGAELAAGLGRTGRLPEPGERWFGLQRMGTDWVGNPNLDPSFNTGLDVSLSLRRSGFSVAGNIFVQEVQDAITLAGQPRQEALPGVMNTLAKSYVNNDATMWGGEIRGAFTLTQRLSLSGDLCYVRGTQESNPDKEITSENLAEMPPLRLRTSLRFSAMRGWAEVEGVFSAAQNRVDGDLLEEKTPAWGIANVKGGVTWHDLTLTVGVSNVFDRLYAQHLSYQRDPYRSGVTVHEPGRAIFGNIGYRF